ncbi:hypothetical protein [uncultured Winogradskyella sp.]|uniref:hypothetical protein n=1 Tax=uncultured Winogradskyella sp. TaxID=395353 RepID=UPI0030DB942C
MKPTQNNSLPCAVFGHNYIKSKTNSNHTSELTCCNCNTVVTTDLRGNFEASTISNKRIQSTLIKLFRLNLNFSKLNFNS